MALCLMTQTKYDRASLMLDQVLKIDPKNEKSLMRKCSISIQMGDHEGANKYLKSLEEVAFQSPNS